MPHLSPRVVGCFGAQTNTNGRGPSVCHLVGRDRPRPTGRSSMSFVRGTGSPKIRDHACVALCACMASKRASLGARSPKPGFSAGPPSQIDPETTVWAMVLFFGPQTRVSVQWKSGVTSHVSEKGKSNISKEGCGCAPCSDIFYYCYLRILPLTQLLQQCWKEWALYALKLMPVCRNIYRHRVHSRVLRYGRKWKKWAHTQSIWRLVHAPLSTDTGAEKARKERQGEKAENEENERAATSNATRSVRKRTAPRCNMNLLASQDDFKSVLAFHKTMQDTAAAVQEPPPASSLALGGGASTSSTGWMKDLHRLQHQLEQMTHNKEQHMQQWQLEREILRSAAAMEGTRNVPSRDTYRKKQGRRYDTERGDGTRRTKADEEEEEEEEELYRRMKRRRRGRRRRKGSKRKHVVVQTPSTSYYTEEEDQESVVGGTSEGDAGAYERIIRRGGDSTNDGWRSEMDSYSDDFECSDGDMEEEAVVVEGGDKEEILQVLQNIRAMRAAVEGTLTSP